MSSFCGEFLLKLFSDLQVDLRTLGPNVIKAWFDTDCKDTQNLLNWMCSSITEKNYVSPLEAVEYFELESTLDDEKLCKELGKLGLDFCSVFENEMTRDELGLLEDEVNILEDENHALEQLIIVYEKLEIDLASELTNTTAKEITAEVKCTKSQETCARMSDKLDETNITLRDRLVKYEPDSHFVNFVDVKDYQDNLDNVKSALIPLMELDKICLEQSDDNLNDAVERARKRILHSYQIFLVNKVEIDTLNGIHDFLFKVDLAEIFANSAFNQLNIEAKELYKKRLCEVLDTIASNYADSHVSQTKVNYLNRELESYRMKTDHTSKLLDIVIKCMSYYHLTIAIQYEEINDIKRISEFFQSMSDYINNDLEKCRNRINGMDLIIKDYSVYMSKPKYEKMNLIYKLVNVLCRDCFDLTSALETVARFRNELNVLEKQLLINDFFEEKKVIFKRMKDMAIMQSFLKSGPTDKVVLIPMGLQQVWLEIEAHLKKESANVAQAVKIPNIARKNLTKSQLYTKQLWMSFITNPSKIDSILRQAESEFNDRTSKHFPGY